MTTIVIALLIFGGFGAWFGWYRGTVLMNRPSLDPLEPAHYSPENDPVRFARGVRRRLLTTMLYALGGCAVAILFLLAITG